MLTKIKVASLINDFGLGGTPRQVVTIDKYLNKNIFEHFVIALNSSDNVRQKNFAGNNVFSVLTPEEVVGLLNKFQIDILHVHRHGRNEPAHDAVAKLWGPNHIIMDLNIFSARDTGTFGDYCQRHIFPSCTNVLKYCVQNAIKFDDNKHNVVYTLFDSAHFLSHFPTKEEIVEYRKKLGISEDTFLIGRLARPVIEKWDDELLIMWKKLSHTNQKSHFVVLGVPEERKKLLQSVGDAHRVTILEPTTSDRELALFYSSINVLAHASPIGECSSGTILEAMYFKKPVVVTSTPFPTTPAGRDHTPDNGQIEQIKNGLNGYVVNDGAAMAGALDYLSRHPEAVILMGEKNNHEVIEKYDAKVGIQTLEKIYLASLLKKNGSLSPELQQYYESKRLYPDLKTISEWEVEYERRLSDVFREKSNNFLDTVLLVWWKGIKRFKRLFL